VSSSSRVSCTSSASETVCAASSTDSGATVTARERSVGTTRAALPQPTGTADG
jgi:hypothetical protein